jgi:hypothetical protein
MAPNYLGDRSNSYSAHTTTAGVRRLNGKADQIQRVPERYANSKFELTDDGILFMQCHILVSYAVNVFKQNRIPDSGAAFFEMVAEPAV